MKKTTFRVIKPLSISKKTLVLLCFILGYIGSINAQFVHPGLSHKQSDLERMKYMVEAEIDPWFSSYQHMVSDSKASYNYAVQGNTSMTVLYRDSPKTNLSAFESDSRAAYYNALQWSITGDSRYADKAVEIFNAWTGLTYLQHTGTRALTSCLIYQMVEAAEIIKSTYSGWAANDIQAFKDMLVYPGYSNTTVPADLTTQGTWYWRAYLFDYVRAGNQELSAIRACLAMGVFLDNEIMYDRALRYTMGLPNRTDDLPYQAGPHIRGSIKSTTEYQVDYNYTIGNTTPDYGFNGVLTNYIYANGQSQESSRDQVHTMWGESLLCSVGEIAWNQGTDFWGASDSRILLGLEYNMKYSVSYIASYPDQPTEWTPTVESGEFIEGMDRTNRTKSLAMSPIYGTDASRILRGTFHTVAAWELPTAHYVGRGLKTEDDAKWTLRAREKSIDINGTYETAPSNGAYLGYGGLTFRRPSKCFGDPISGFDGNNLPVYNMNGLPMTIEAENFDYSTVSGENRIYRDTSIGNSRNEYRTDENVDLKECTEGGYNVTDIASGEWLTYTVNIPNNGTYDILIRYASINANGTIKFNIGGTDVTTDVVVPFGGSHSTGLSDWKDFTVASNVTLTKGVQALKIYFNGVDNAFELNNFTVNLISNQDDIDACGAIIANSQINAEDYCDSQGVEIKAVSEGGSYIGGIQKGDFLNYGVFNFNENSINAAEVAIGKSSTKDTFVEIRLDSDNGTLIGTIDVSETTGGSQNWKASSAALANVSGSHEVFLVFNGQANTTLANFNWFRFYNDISLSVEEGNNALISMYPNPVIDVFTVANSQGSVLEIHDMLGKLLLQTKVENNNKSFDVSYLNQGVYFVSIKNNGVFITEKIVKN